MRRTGAPSQRTPGFRPPTLFSPPSSSHLAQDNSSSQIAIRDVSSQHRAPLHSLNNSNNCQNSSHDSSEGSSFKYFSCVWAKKSGRKHKKWEGDALIKVGTRSVILIETSGKELSRGSGYKIQELADLEDGGRLSVGSKEVEISEAVDSNTWYCALKQNSISKIVSNERKEETGPETFPPPSQITTSEDSQTAQLIVGTTSHKTNFKPFQVPSRVNTTLSTFVPERRVQPGQAMFDVSRPGALVMPRPPASHPLNVPDKLVDVVMDPFISKQLRQHQREGVLFLYSNLLGFKTITTDDNEVFPINGAILADEMGLGKTLQTVSLIWTFIKQSPVAGKVLAKKILIVTPSSLLKNWENEFRKWLGSERVTIHIADTGDKVSQFRNYTTAPILMLSYEMLVRTASELAQVSWDLVVCDEAHRMKNATIKTSSCLAQIQCPRKLLLTGTPVQNDLGEFYNLVDLACPGALGSRAKFSREIESRVDASRQPEASLEDIEDGEVAIEKLKNLTNFVILRRTSDIINKFLPPKTVYVVFCRATPYQERVYTATVDRMMDSLGGSGGQHLTAITSLRKISNAPSLTETLPGPGQGGPDTWEEQSGKLATLTCLLLELVQSTQEKIVLVSLTTSSLDLLQSLCDKYSVAWARLDGSTPSTSRQSIVNNFNTSSVSLGGPRVMLLSSKAGGTGLNLIGASRLVLYDIDWNPATDLQAMARVWRDGQKRPCHVYRLVTTGTIEEKILQRQVTKRGLDSHTVVPSHFTSDELRDLFSYNKETESDTHDKMGCDCGGSQEHSVIDGESSVSVKEGERQCQLGGGGGEPAPDDQLLDWSHLASPVDTKLQDPILSVASPFVSFVMMKSFYCDSQVD